MVQKLLLYIINATVSSMSLTKQFQPMTLKHISDLAHRKKVGDP